MICSNCGYENQDSYTFCPQCGGSLTPQEAPKSPLLGVLQDKLFLVMCILLSCISGFTLLSGSVPLLQGLCTIFLWIVYSHSRKGTVNTQQLRSVSGTIYASYIINFVLSGILVLMGIVCAAAFGVIFSSTDYVNEILSYFTDSPEVFTTAGALLGSLSGWVFFFAFVLAAGVIVVFNIFSIGQIHTFVKSVYQNAETGTENYLKVIPAKNWLIVLAVFSGINALSSLSDSFMAALSSGCTCALYITAVLLITKYFIPKEQQVD